MGNNYFHSSSVQGWAVKLGTELYHFGEFITRKKEVQDVSNTHRPDIGR